MSEPSNIAASSLLDDAPMSEELDTQVGAAHRLAVILTNCTAAEAPTIAEALVREQLAACVNAIPGVRSYYVWQGDFVVDDETTLWIKTPEGSVDALVRRLRELHSYSTPEIVMLMPTAVDAKYLMWALDQAPGGRS